MFFRVPAGASSSGARTRDMGSGTQKVASVAEGVQGFIDPGLRLLQQRGHSQQLRRTKYLDANARPAFLTWIGYESNQPAIQNAAVTAGPSDRRLYLDIAAVLRRGVLGSHPGYHLCPDAAASAGEIRLEPQPDLPGHPDGVPGDCDSASDHHQRLAGAGGGHAVQKCRKRQVGRGWVYRTVQELPAALLSASSGPLRHGQSGWPARENRQERDAG